MKLILRRIQVWIMKSFKFKIVSFLAYRMYLWTVQGHIQGLTLIPTLDGQDKLSYEERI